MKLGILTDSTCDLPAHALDEFEIEVVPAVIIIEGRPHLDGKDITREQFYTRLPSLRTAPTTAMPAPGEFATAMQRLFDQGCTDILALHAASQLTGIINGSRLAAADFDGHVTVHDSGSLTLGLGFQVIAAAQAAANGAGPDEALAAAQSVRKRLYIRAVLDTLDYVRRSGRVPGLIGALGGLLRIKPYIALEEGEVRAGGAVRTTAHGTEKVYEGLQQLGDLESLAILHTNAEARARGLLDRLMRARRMSLPREILIVNVTPAIGTHVGPNGLGFAAVIK
jgi:fatty acid kinase fatty acid binding subunit